MKDWKLINISKYKTIFLKKLNKILKDFKNFLDLLSLNIRNN